MSLQPSDDAFGRGLLDHLEGADGPPLMLESDDGNIRTADLQPADFFVPHEAWPAWERDALANATDAILDLVLGQVATGNLRSLREEQRRLEGRPHLLIGQLT